MSQNPIYYPLNQTVVSCTKSDERSMTIWISRQQKILLSLDVGGNASISMSNAGLLAVSNYGTSIFDLNEKKLGKPKKEIDGYWIIAKEGGSLFSVSTKSNPLIDARGTSFDGLVRRGLGDEPFELINPKARIHPRSLFLSPDGSSYVCVDNKNKTLQFGEGEEFVGSFVWNKGLLGELPENLVLDHHNRQVFVNHSYFKFRMLSKITFGGQILSLKQETSFSSEVTKIDDKYIVAVTSSVVNQKPLNQIFELAPDSMTLKLANPAILPLNGSVDFANGKPEWHLNLVPMDQGDSICLISNSGYVFWDYVQGRQLDVKTDEKPSSDQAHLENVKAEFLSLAKDFVENSTVRDECFDKASSIAEAEDFESEYAELYEALYFGVLPLYQYAERLICLSPVFDKEFSEWPLVEFDVEFGFTLKKVHEDRGHDLSLFSDSFKEYDQVSASKLFKQSWVGVPPNIKSAALALTEGRDDDGSVLFGALEAIAQNSESASYTKLREAGEAFEEANDFKLATLTYYNSFVGVRFERLSGPHWEKLLLLSNSHASKSFRTYLGLILMI